MVIADPGGGEALAGRDGDEVVVEGIGDHGGGEAIVGWDEVVAEAIGDPDGGEVVVEVPGPLTVDAEWGERLPTGRRELRLRIRYDGAEPAPGTVRVSRSVPAAEPWWLIPGLFYGENRPAACERVFPRFETGADRPDEMVSARWGFRADRAATPAVMVWGDLRAARRPARVRAAAGARAAEGAARARRRRHPGHRLHQDLPGRPRASALGRNGERGRAAKAWGGAVTAWFSHVGAPSLGMVRVFGPGGDNQAGRSGPTAGLAGCEACGGHVRPVAHLRACVGCRR
ncbi:hypothetical protein ITP53_27000 [Nonomuraea sp. K274]|uniref:Uncharacterized protein n=1 Tax=Nonomuraea cypriaca TaxID=1187855 RepID=A0A931AHM8_9ACTN|nr:hypothetical protein [Nonomuraea cypriaca]MBF8189317.1 hypothetical protein [Nonomuraea cypriaca]